MLSGNLELFALADVLRFVARSGATGAVNIYRPSSAGRILLADGEVVGASIDGLAAADADGVVDVVMRLMDAPGGEFALELEPVHGPARRPVEELLKAVAHRRSEWRKILAAIGPPDAALEVEALVPAGAAEITLTPLEWHIAVLADGRRSLRDLAAEAGTSEFAAARALLAMANAGLLALPGAAPATGAGEDQPEEEPEQEPEEPEPLAGIAYEDEESEEVAEEPEDAAEGEPAEEDLDPAELLRELGETRGIAPRARGPAGPGAERRLRIRSR